MKKLGFHTRMTLNNLRHLSSNCALDQSDINDNTHLDRTILISNAYLDRPIPTPSQAFGLV